MPWPRHVGALLKIPGSRAGQALRWGLRGLRASLQAALDDSLDDPASENLRPLLAELDALLDRAPSFAAVLPSDDLKDLRHGGDAELPLPTGGQDSEPASSLRLFLLRQAVAQDPRLQPGGKRPPIRESSDDEIWNDVQRLLLRLPSGLGQEWKQLSLQYAEKAGARADGAPAIVLP